VSRVVSLAGRRVDLRAVDPLATGGEATVWAVDGRALKLWHAPGPSRVAKLRALLSRRRGLPAAVVAPDEEVHDATTGEIVGFAMPLLAASFEPIAMLGRATQRASRGVTHRVAIAVLSRFLEALRALHAAGIVVGDLSDQNVAVDAGASDPVRILDADSLQLDGLPCEVSTEAFLDPHLYGPDPAQPCATADGRPRHFTPESDGYAFAVLLFRMLIGSHPYGGALDALPTLSRRALARASVLHPDVKAPPRVRLAIDVLGAPLRARFEAIFERGDRASFDVAGLEDYAASLVACGCGLEIPASRLPCPRCAPSARAVVPVAHGRLRGEIVLEAAGPVVAVAAAAAVVLAVAIEAARPVLYVVRAGHVEKHLLCGDSARGGWDVALAPSVVAVAPRGAESVAALHVAAIGARGIVQTTSATDRSAGAAAMAVAHDVVFRVARGTVMAGCVAAGGLVERPVATVVRGAAWLFGAPLGETPAAIVLGSAVGAPRWEVVTARGATALDAPALALGETIREVAAYGDDGGFLVLARTLATGRALVRSVRFDLAGRRTSDRTAPEDGRAAEDVVVGGAYRGGAVVVSTAGGLVREDANGAARSFPDAAPFTAAGAPVALARRGVLVADGRCVRRLELS
jgi:hypothetical protein